MRSCMSVSKVSPLDAGPLTSRGKSEREKTSGPHDAREAPKARATHGGIHETSNSPIPSIS